MTPAQEALRALLNHSEHCPICDNKAPCPVAEAYADAAIPLIRAEKQTRQKAGSIGK